MSQIILALRGDEAIYKTVADLRLRFKIPNTGCDRHHFYKICRSESIRVLESADLLAVRGVYMFCTQWRAIGISLKLSKRSFLKVAFHELGHHFLHGHYQREHFFQEPQTLNDYVREAQANMFSDLMLLEVKDDK